jgi:hypothetical protein
MPVSRDVVKMACCHALLIFAMSVECSADNIRNPSGPPLPSRQSGGTGPFQTDWAKPTQQTGPQIRRDDLGSAPRPPSAAINAPRSPQQNRN